MKRKWLVAVFFVVLMLCPVALAANEMEIKDEVLLFYTGEEEICEIPDGVKKIGEYAFCGNARIKEVILPQSLRIIGDHAFESCVALERVHVAKGLESIGESSFYHCKELREITLPDQLSSIGEEAFAFCTALEQISLPESLEFVERRVFAGCSALKTVELPVGVTAIEEEAFAYCRSLNTVSIPEGMLRLAGRAFWGCSQLQMVTLPVSLQYLGIDCLPLHKKLHVIADGNVYAEEWCTARGIELSHRGNMEPYWLYIENAHGVPEISNKAGSVIHYGYNAVDIDDSTAWQCKGAGGYIDMELQTPGAVNQVLIKTGHHKSKTNYQNYSRPIQVELSFCYEGSNAFVDPVVCDIEDKYSTDFFSMEFDWRLNVTKIRMTVLKVKKGKELPYNVAVAELRAVGIDMAELPYDFLQQGETATFE